MKSLTTLFLSVCFASGLVALSADVASAQDDDDLFGTDEAGTDTSTDDGMTDDGAGSGATDTGEAGAVEDSAVSGDVGRSAGTLGLGFSATTNGITGVEAEYWLSPTLMISALGRLTIFSGDAADVTSLQVGAGALLVLKSHGKSALLAGGRFLLGYASAGDNSTTSIAIEIPLRLQMSLHPMISAHVEGGAAILIGDQTGLDPFSTDAGFIDFGFGVGTNNLYGGAGLTFYFK